MNEHVNRGGDEIAPVIPLFGRSTPASPDESAPAQATSEPRANAWVNDENPADSTDAEGWWVDPEQAPVRPLSSAPSAANAHDEAGSRRRHPTSSSIPLPTIGGAKKPTLMKASELSKPADERRMQPLPGADIESDDAPKVPSPARGARGQRGTAQASAPRSRPRLRVIESIDDETSDESPEQQRHRAEAALLKKLRGKGLSISEARAYVRGLDVSDDIQHEVVDACIARRYLDDAVLAEQIVYAGSTRKGQGRRAIALALSARGIDRDIANAALAELPDDDDERALEYARTKAMSLSRLEPEVALRRLMGQLARRGFSGGIARDAAQQALREVSRPRFR
ncbi:regulatory protein RecX [Microbacterium sp. NC79]|uniref:regulatory protein RecX n=1 Tax=Microbacterium sp. NC79 TaxID=2851009 RepID=UPI001C2C01C1|nr:regulatory protein RecX [Microbacterium sp. NC79]MBV0895221.1 RecX family transcriptional regulator [Microbacterium sp. NC79]